MAGKGKRAAMALVIPDGCHNCRFWARFAEEHGRCRRFPPTPLASAGQTQPITDGEVWCGEHDQAAAEASNPVGFAPPAPKEKAA